MASSRPGGSPPVSWRSLPRCGRLARLPWAWTSFAVFVLHTYVTSAMRIGAALPPAYSCGYYVCVIGFAVGVPMGVAWVLNEYAKPLASVLFGGRVKK